MTSISHRVLTDGDNQGEYGAYRADFVRNTTVAAASNATTLIHNNFMLFNLTGGRGQVQGTIRFDDATGGHSMHAEFEISVASGAITTIRTSIFSSSGSAKVLDASISSGQVTLIVKSNPTTTLTTSAGGATVLAEVKITKLS